MHVTTMSEFAAPEGFGRIRFRRIKIGRPSWKGLKSSIKGTGHFVGKVASSKITKGILAAGLAATGVGVGASAAIMGTMGVTGGALRKGGGLKKAVRGGIVGAGTGAVAGGVGKLLPKIPGVRVPVRALRKASSGVTGLRRIAAKPSPMSPAVAPVSTAPIVSYEDDKKLDTLMALPLPTPSVLPSTSVTDVGPPPFISQTQQDAMRETVVATVKRDRAKRAAKKALEMATDLTTPPSANPTAPQGGFPATPMTISPENQNQDSEVSPVKQAGIAGMPPMMLAVAGIAAFMLFNNKR